MSGKTLDMSEARKQFNSLDSRLKDDPILVITRHNRRAFAIVDIDTLEAMLETFEIISDPESFKVFQQSLEDIREGRLHSHEDVERELG